MKKVSMILAFLIVVGIIIPAVSADEIYNRTFTEIVDTTIESGDMGVSSDNTKPGIYISDVSAITTKTTLRQVEADLYDGNLGFEALLCPPITGIIYPLMVRQLDMLIWAFKFVDVILKN